MLSIGDSKQGYLREKEIVTFKLYTNKIESFLYVKGLTKHPLEGDCIQTIKSDKLEDNGIKIGRD